MVSIYAVVASGGKQHRVAPGTVIDVEKLPGEPGARVELGEVLLLARDGQVIPGTPTVPGARVVAEVQEQLKGPKIVVGKYKAKTHYRKRQGHRQRYTRLLIKEVLGPEV